MEQIEVTIPAGIANMRLAIPGEIAESLDAAARAVASLDAAHGPVLSAPRPENPDACPVRIVVSSGREGSPAETSGLMIWSSSVVTRPAPHRWRGGGGSQGGVTFGHAHGSRCVSRECATLLSLISASATWSVVFA